MNRWLVGFALFESAVFGVLGIIVLLTVRSWLFWLIQVVSVNLTIVGWFVCAVLAALKLETTQPRELPPVGLAPNVVWGWPKLFWLWSNGEDGVWGPGAAHTRWNAYTWTAWRNSVNNLRFVKRFLWLPISVSKVGRQLWYRTWTIFGKEFYGKAGWMSDGYPAFSAGAGRGY